MTLGEVAEDSSAGLAYEVGPLAGIAADNEPESVEGRRAYDNTLRQQRATDTRLRIVEAGCELLQGASIRDWKGLTIRVVAERAGVNERTVYRHFGTERALKDAVMHQLEERAGIDLSNLTLAEIAEVTARIFSVVSSHPFEPRSPLDVTLSETSLRQRNALLKAVAGETPGWSISDRTAVAALFDVLWSVASYERLARDWELESEQATDSITWVVGLIEQAILEGRRPTAP